MDFEPDEFLQVWTLTAESALRFFGLEASEHEVVVLKDKPTTDREVSKYKPEAKLFGIRAIPAVPGAHSMPEARLVRGYVIKRIGYSEYLSAMHPELLAFSHVPAGALNYDDEEAAQRVLDQAQPALKRRGLACAVFRVA